MTYLQPLTIAACAGLSFGLFPQLMGGPQAEAAPRGTYEMAPAQEARPALAGAKIIYLNRNGGTYTPSSYNDAQSNRSTIPNTTSVIPPFEQSNENWNALVACVKYQYAWFNVDIRTSDPSPADHIEAVVGGAPQDLGRDPNTGGVAPFPSGCSPYSSAIVFNFSEKYTDQMESLCFTVAQEVGHALGLDHAFLCEDPMTYLAGCGFKSFQDTWANCGENEVRSCRCSSTQNTVNHLATNLGTRSDVAYPTVSITSPVEGGSVMGGFVAKVTAADDLAVARVEILLDGAQILDSRFGPYEIKTSLNLPLGAHTLEAKVWDIAGKQRADSKSFTVTVDGKPPQCFKDEDCQASWICYNLQCFEQVDLAGIGESCQSNADCLSALCGSDASGSFCTQECTDDSQCNGLQCIDSGGGFNVCWPRPGGDGGNGGTDDGGGGICAAGGGGGSTVLLLLLAAMLAVLPRRQRSS